MHYSVSCHHSCKNLLLNVLKMATNNKLRLITYLAPGVPMELFETIMYYLEEETGKEGYLITESRWSGPPPERTDPFTADEADIGFMCSSGFLRLLEHKNKNIELCKAGFIPLHSKAQNRSVYFSEVIINSANAEKYKELHDLRGHTFAYNDPMSMSGTLVMLSELKKMGFNATFFGNVFQSGSHLNSIQLVLDQKVSAAAIDSNTMAMFLASHPEYKNNIKVLCSFGPLPMYPIVFNSKLPDELKNQIQTALLKMHTLPEWKARLNRCSIERFTEIDISLYNVEKELKEFVKGQSIASAAYY
ncbi:hypothetical protein KUTeg_009366 [Tegillarca granosa]|uniref:Uncharacterized protein n=1 Tax=Tegillarca granosa TaxID=220873 RepID=A0ABQ9F3M6_TEGGR|nr:hypothetical protein KUTeg_009366 [Tegillarca granosa]